MRVAKGQTIPNSQSTKVQFELLNPKYGQPGPEMSTVLISASGTVPLAATSMQLSDVAKPPLKVTSAVFTMATVEQTSHAPGADNTITVSATMCFVLP
jgi:hypothetical protein